jgi:hypothetical protein
MAGLDAPVRRHGPRLPVVPLPRCPCGDVWIRVLFDMDNNHTASPGDRVCQGADRNAVLLARIDAPGAKIVCGAGAPMPSPPGTQQDAGALPLPPHRRVLRNAVTRRKRAWHGPEKLAPEHCAAPNPMPAYIPENYSSSLPPYWWNVSFQVCVP